MTRILAITCVISSFLLGWQTPVKAAPLAYGICYPFDQVKADADQNNLSEARRYVEHTTLNRLVSIPNTNVLTIKNIIVYAKQVGDNPEGYIVDYNSFTENSCVVAKGRFYKIGNLDEYIKYPSSSEESFRTCKAQANPSQCIERSMVNQLMSDNRFYATTVEQGGIKPHIVVLRSKEKSSFISNNEYGGQYDTYIIFVNFKGECRIINRIYNSSMLSEWFYGLHADPSGDAKTGERWQRIWLTNLVQRANLVKDMASKNYTAAEIQNALEVIRLMAKPNLP